MEMGRERKLDKRTHNSNIDFVWTLIGEKSFGDTKDWILGSGFDAPEPR